MTLDVVSPVAGVAVPLSAVPDRVFSESLVGPGVAVDPVRAPDVVLAPISGHVAKLHPHAFVVIGDGGRGVLVHLGIDTVELQGDGFELLVAEGDAVAAGGPILRWDPAVVESSGRSPLCAVVALDATAEHVVETASGASVSAGEVVFRWR